MGYFEGGNRLQAFTDPTVIRLFLKDPDIPLEYNEDKKIGFTWKCTNLETGGACLNSVEKPVTVNQSVYWQEFRAKQLMPYKTYNFEVKARKGEKSLLLNGIVIIIEVDLPVLSTALPAGYTNRKVNLNELLKIMVVPDGGQDPDSLRFSAQMIYDYDQVSVWRFDYLAFQFKIWDKFSAVDEFKNQIQVKVAAKDPYFYMPSISTLLLALNIPPRNGTLTINPAFGYALTTTFTIALRGWVDSDHPINYKLNIYRSRQTMEDDLVKGIETNKVVLTDY